MIDTGRLKGEGAMTEKTGAEQSSQQGFADSSEDAPKPSRKASMVPLVAIAIALALSSVITDSCNSQQPISIRTPSFEKVTLSTSVSVSVPEPSVAVESSSASGSENGSTSQSTR